MEKLSKKQQELIEKYYSEVKLKLTKKLYNNTKIGRHYRSRQEMIDSALSYMVESALAFDIKKCQKETYFPTWSFYYCIHRLIDDYRSKSVQSCIFTKRKLYKTIKEKLITENGYASHSEIVDYIKEKYGISILKREVHIESDIDMFRDSIPSNVDFTKEIEWNDLKEHMLSRLEDKFCSEKDYKYKVVFNEYLLPKAERRPYKTLDTIAKELGCSSCYVSFIAHSDKMKRFVELSMI